MPQYDYRCQNCKEYFSIERSMNDADEPVCEHCGAQNATRIWNVQFAATAGSSKKDAKAKPAQPRPMGGGCCGGGACGTGH